jgi:hypothetical protein
VDLICRRALAVDRDDRFGSALEMQKALEESIAKLPQRASERDVGEVISRLFAQERQSIAAVIVALLDSTSTKEFALQTLPALSVAAGVMSLTPGRDPAPATLGGAAVWPWSASSAHRRRTILVLMAVFGVLAAVAVWAFSEATQDPTSASTAGLKPQGKAAGAPGAVLEATIPTSTTALPTTATADAIAADANPTRSPSSPAFAPPPRRVPSNAFPRSNPIDAPAPPAQAVPMPHQAATAPTFGPLDDRH